MDSSSVITLDLLECALVCLWQEHYKKHQSRESLPFDLSPEEKSLSEKITAPGSYKKCTRGEAEIIRTWMTGSFFSRYLANPTVYGAEQKLYEKVHQCLGLRSNRKKPAMFSSRPSKEKTSPVKKVSRQRPLSNVFQSLLIQFLSPSK